MWRWYRHHFLLVGIYAMFFVAPGLLIIMSLAPTAWWGDSSVAGNCVMDWICFGTGFTYFGFMAPGLALSFIATDEYLPALRPFNH